MPETTRGRASAARRRANPPARKNGPLEKLRRQLRLQHKSPRTEKAYSSWVRRYLHFRHRAGLDPNPARFTDGEVSQFLSHLANERRVSASTHNQALCALIFFHRHVLQKELGELDLVRPRRRRKLPVVLTRDEVREILKHLRGRPKLVIALL
ncbi:MAG: phage integrase N-terminal SAM-like domain-containing protein, partial [Holophagales bacterium]|nr:phage integrase N-terminal SAM-like domain-containing protein [Holophagales bacterium]